MQRSKRSLSNLCRHYFFRMDCWMDGCCNISSKCPDSLLSPFLSHFLQDASRQERWGGKCGQETSTKAHQDTVWLIITFVKEVMFSAFVCLSAGLQKNYRPDFYVTWWKGVSSGRGRTQWILEHIQINPLFLTFVSFVNISRFNIQRSALSKCPSCCIDKCFQIWWLVAPFRDKSCACNPWF